MSLVLDVVERLLVAADHPDVAAVERYGRDLGPWGPSKEESKVPSITGVRVVHQSTATASLWEAVWPGEQIAQPPEVMPPVRSSRAGRPAILAGQLLDVARPPEFRAWRLVTLPGIGKDPTLPSGLSIALADGGRMLLLAQATGPTLGDDPDEDPFPDWQPPALLA